MGMTKASILFLGALIFVSVPTSALFVLKAEVNDMMFVPKPRDREMMAKALTGRFGAKVVLLDLPVVNRDVNGYAALVQTTVPSGVYRSEMHTFSFERIDGRDVCLMTHLPWELEPLRTAYRTRYRGD